MNQVFNSVYAESYDALYHDKDYAAEGDLIEHIFQIYGDNSIHSILDLGCGTGNHTFCLSQRGYEVVGVDRSESMLAQARKKLAYAGGNGGAVFQQGDVRSVELQRHFDAVLIMFAVLGYQLENVDVLSALRTARRHLRPGGILIFDVWYGPAVLHQRPSQKVKVVQLPAGQILRVSSGEIDTGRHLCKVHFHIWRLEGSQLVAEVEESHLMRYFFPLELCLFLECAGLAPIRLGAFPEFDQDPNETTWNILGVGRAV